MIQALSKRGMELDELLNIDLSKKTIHDVYVENYDEFLSPYQTDLTTIYDAIIYNINGLTALEITLYSKTIPTIEQLNGEFDQWFSQLNNLKSGFLTAVNGFSKELEGTSVSRIESDNGRITKIHQMDNDYFMTITYDDNKDNYVELEEFMSKLYSRVEDLMDNYSKGLERFRKIGGSLDEFKTLNILIRKTLNIGFNNQDFLEKIEQLKNKLESHVNKITTPSLIKQNKVTQEDIAKGYRMLNNFKKLFPFYQSKLLESLKTRVEDLDKPLDLLDHYSKIMKQKDVNGLIKELDNPVVKKYLKVDNMIKELEQAKGDETRTQMTLIDVKDHIKSTINPSLIKFKQSNKLSEEMIDWLSKTKKKMKSQVKANIKENSQKTNEPASKEPETLDELSEEIISWLKRKK